MLVGECLDRGDSDVNLLLVGDGRAILSGVEDGLSRVPEDPFD